MGEARQTAWQTALHRSYKLVVEHRAPKIMPKRPKYCPHVRLLAAWHQPRQSTVAAWHQPRQPIAPCRGLVADATSLWHTPQACGRRPRAQNIAQTSKFLPKHASICCLAPAQAARCSSPAAAYRPSDRELASLSGLPHVSHALPSHGRGRVRLPVFHRAVGEIFFFSSSSTTPPLI